MNDNTVTNTLYITALQKLLTLCAFHDIEISEIKIMYNGFRVTFKDFPEGDAICHDLNNWGNLGYWETMGFEWDNGHVTRLTTKQLIHLLSTH